MSNAFTRHKIRSGVAAGAVVVLGLGGFGYWWKFVRKDEKPVNVKSVEQQFAKRRAGQGTEPGYPASGVYLYRTTGSESVSALGGQSNTYPATTTLTVTDSACGVDTRWDVITGRYDLNRRCRRADGTWVLVGTVTSDRFFNQTQADPSRCDAVELPAAPKTGQTWTGRCTQGADTATMRYLVQGRETLTIGGRSVSTWHLRITTTQGGQRSGGGTENRWVIPETNLVVKSVSDESDNSPSPVGEVTYKQHYENELQSLTPRG